VQCCFRFKAQGSSCRLGETKKARWGLLLDTAVYSAARAKWELKREAHKFPWQILSLWYPIELETGNRGRDFATCPRIPAATKGRCQCGGHCTLPHTITYCGHAEVEAISNEHLRNRLELLNQAGVSPRYTTVWRAMDIAQLEGIGAETKAIEDGTPLWDKQQLELALILRCQWDGAVGKGLVSKLRLPFLYAKGTRTTICLMTSISGTRWWRLH
jgi:hypothetical protein